MLPATAIGPIVLMLGTALPSTCAAIVRRTRAQLETVADLKSVQIDRWLYQGRDTARLVARMGNLPQRLSTFLHPPTDQARAVAEIGLVSEIQSLSDVFSHVGSVSVLRLTGGQVVLSTDAGEVGRVRRGEDYFVFGKDSLYVSPVVYSVGSEAPVMTVATPLHREDGELLAVLAVEMNLADLDASLSGSAGLGTTGRAYLVDAYGFYVTTPAGSGRGPLRALAQSEGVRRAVRGESGADSYQGPDGVRVVGVYRWLPDAGLGLLVEIDEAELSGQIIRVFALMLLLSAGVAVLGIVAARRLAGWLVSPLERIAGTARPLQAGEPGQRAPSVGPDEIGQLAVAFNEMADSLQRPQ